MDPSSICASEYQKAIQISIIRESFPLSSTLSSSRSTKIVISYILKKKKRPKKVFFGPLKLHIDINHVLHKI